ncbi:hypothetical protein SARC_11701 [Sphaeroforma arctica JP610]|uniref:SGNH domain-containing protein n=1 Tax=Sphaeroforma arctica JP610 TaxID=667725 RepID=A0A0L0FH25_9EUKA|nr:hypothetical protein SARC_11701 [Sphaeroforma arctica JP610]KNC75781.1 hypothetical protein SARC_11701 [Sphaeroforma arctica JP610]|eukprot:XP_014149683.1 hypothetical protein SARC_11701 [Sphaeroforma arctica JP610]
MLHDKTRSLLKLRNWLLASLALVGSFSLMTIGLTAIRIVLEWCGNSRSSFLALQSHSSLKSSSMCERKFGSCGTVPDFFRPFVNLSEAPLVWDDPSRSTKLPPKYFTELVRDAFAESNNSDWQTFYSGLITRQMLALENSQVSEQLCYMNFVSTSYRTGKTGEQPLYARITFEETCFLNDRDWVHFEFIPIDGAPTVNEDAYVTYPSKGVVVVEIPCLSNGGISKSMGDACQRMSNKLPFGLGFWSHNQTVWNSYCNTEAPSLPIKDKNIVLHLVGDSTMEELLSAFIVNATLKGHTRCGGNVESSGRPCHSYYTSTTRGVAFTFTLITEPFGWKAKNIEPQLGTTAAPWNSASLSETCTFITKIREQYSVETRHVVLFNFGLHGVSNHGLFRLAYEQALVSIQKNLGYFADIVAVGVSPSNPTRKSYHGMDCRSEVNVARAREIIECVASTHGILVLDRTMMQFGLWSLYKDYVHLGITSRAQELRHFIVDEYVRAAVYVAHASSRTQLT